MPLPAASLTAPAGPLASGLLAQLGAARAPVVDGPSVAAGYANAANAHVLTDGFAFAPLDVQTRAAVAWAAAGALEERAQQILADQLSGGAEGASFGYSSSQAAELRKSAADWRARYEALRPTAAVAPGSSGGGGVRAVRPGSRSVSAVTAW